MSESELPPRNTFLSALLDGERLNELGPGTPDRSQHQRLHDLSLEQIVAPRPVKDRNMATACLAGLWLWCDFLDQSHTISQSLDTPEGSYWHGIMHRREPDYENAKYWFQRVGEHPIHGELASRAHSLAGEQQARADDCFLRTQEKWDAFVFVDLCQASARGDAPHGQLCRLVQREEWRLLFEYCLLRADGGQG
jgi:hypothetical protein